MILGFIYWLVVYFCNTSERLVVCHADVTGRHRWYSLSASAAFNVVVVFSLLTVRGHTAQDLDQMPFLSQPYYFIRDQH